MADLSFAKDKAIAEVVRKADPTGQYSTVLLAACNLDRRRLPDEDRCPPPVKSKANKLMTFTNVGKPLAKYLQTQPDVTLQQFAGTMATMLRALRHFHAAGVYHYDLHDDNIMVEPSTGVVRFIDFGGQEFLKHIYNKFNFTLHWSHPYVDLYALRIAAQKDLEQKAIQNLVNIVPAYYRVKGYHMRPAAPDTILERVLFWPVGQLSAFDPRDAVNKAKFQAQHKQETTEMLQRVLTENVAYIKAVPFKPSDPVWAPLDVFGAGAAGLVGMQIMQDRGLDTAAGLAGLKADLMQLCTNLVTPLIAARPTAAQAWDAVQVLCAKHGVAIPPAEPMLG
jgi:hypothetical protein